MTDERHHRPEHLSDLIREAEAVADKYSNGGLMFSRTKSGWRAFLGDFEGGAFRRLEKALDKNIPSHEKAILGEKFPRSPTLSEEIETLLTDLLMMLPPGEYRPMKLTETD